MSRNTSAVVKVFGALGIAAMSCVAASAQETAAPAIDSGDTAFVLMSAALVLFMSVGLAFFYGGLVRRKNVLSILMQCFFAMGILSVVWVLIGYTLSFGPDVSGIIGGLDWIGLRNVGLTPHETYGPTIPHFAFMAFQGMFAVITPALIIGAFAERMKFGAYCLFITIWSLVVYAPVCHWVWGGGFLGGMGALDFAGGTVVHITAGIAGLVCAIMLGKRTGYPDRAVVPHNLPFSVIGAGILWFGWFGFNAGSALAANGTAAGAFVATNVSAAAAAITWGCIEWMSNGSGKPTMLGTITGAVAGLVAVTPAAGFVGPVSAILIGVGASAICYCFVAFVKPKFGYDDSLDVFGVHGVGGIWGALATGLFACTKVNPAGNDGLFFGNPGLFLIQAEAVIVTIVYSVVCTVIILKVVGMITQLRVQPGDERFGVDLLDHHERAYTLID